MKCLWYLFLYNPCCFTSDHLLNELMMKPIDFRTFRNQIEVGAKWIYCISKGQEKDILTEAEIFFLNSESINEWIPSACHFLLVVFLTFSNWFSLNLAVQTIKYFTRLRNFSESWKNKFAIFICDKSAPWIWRLFWGSNLKIERIFEQESKMICSIGRW